MTGFTRMGVWTLTLALPLGACSTRHEETQRLAARPTDTLRAMPAHVSHGPSATCRKLLRAEQQGFASRRHELVQRYLRELITHGISAAPDHTSRSVRRIAAALTALREERAHAAAFPGSPALYHPSVPADLPARVERWSRELKAFGVPGTSAGLGAPRGDYDFVMKELVALLYLFRDEPTLLTDEASWNIVERALSPAALGDPKAHLTFEVRVPLIGSALRYPETENHVLMTLSSIALTRAFIAENPRQDARIDRLRRLHPQLAELGAFRDALLQAMGRILHNGFFETNARPYQALSAHALLNTYAFAPDEVLRTAAQTALDYLSAVFAFQSLEHKRFGPYRRSAGYADRVGVYENDGVVFMMGALAGGRSWPESFHDAGNATGHALWAALLPYRIPDAVHELMLHKHTGYWSRMHTRFSSSDYRKGAPGRYLASARGPQAQRNLEALPELYFVTSRFLNAAGGRFNRLPVTGDTLKPTHGVQDLDFLSRPHALLPRGHLGHWKSLSDMAQQAMLMPGSARFWRSDNSGTYKSFSYGYRERPGRDVHLRFPMRIPRAWDPHVYREGVRNEWSASPASRAHFRFVDLSNVEPYGFYVVLARVSKSDPHPRYRQVSRGFWEVVPKERFPTVAALKEATLRDNPAQHFTDITHGPGRLYRYRMTTGELLELDDALGHSDKACPNPIQRLWAAEEDGEARALPLSDYLYDRCDATAIERAPLLDVREVDANYRFTGRRLAYAGGDGQLIVDNPYIGATLWLDSSEYDRPVRTAGDLPRDAAH